MKSDLFTREKQYVLFVFLSSIITLLTIQVLFYFIQFSHLDSSRKGIREILRSEVTSSNSYNVSKSIRDLEFLELLECSVLKTSKVENRAYIDLTFNKNCKGSFFLLNGVNALETFSLSNGETWNITFKSVNNKGFYFALWLTRILFLLFIFVVFRIYVEKIRRKIELSKLELLHAEEIKKISRQVSHDIRSPLAALDVAIEDLEESSEETLKILKMSVQRIQNIANNLLSKTKYKDLSKAFLEEEVKKVLVEPLLDEIISEKKLEFRNKIGIVIEKRAFEGEELFFRVNSSSFKRVLSNLINNAVEALPNDKGRVLLSIKKGNDKVIVEIKDDGKGIPDNVLKRLGQEGASFGKEEKNNAGSGLGLHYAITSVKKWRGRLMIDSRLGKGTTVTVELPLESNKTPIK